MKYKYNILHRLNKLPYARTKLFYEQAYKQFNIHELTLRKWLYIKDDESLEIRASILIQIAEFFEVHPKELYATPPPKLIIEPLTESPGQTNLLELIENDNNKELH